MIKSISSVQNKNSGANCFCCHHDAILNQLSSWTNKARHLAVTVCPRPALCTVPTCLLTATAVPSITTAQRRPVRLPDPERLSQASRSLLNLLLGHWRWFCGGSVACKCEALGSSLQHMSKRNKPKQQQQRQQQMWCGALASPVLQTGRQEHSQVCWAADLAKLVSSRFSQTLSQKTGF